MCSVPHNHHEARWLSARWVQLFTSRISSHRYVCYACRCAVVLQFVLWVRGTLLGQLGAPHTHYPAQALLDLLNADLVCMRGSRKRRIVDPCEAAARRSTRRRHSQRASRAAKRSRQLRQMWEFSHRRWGLSQSMSSSTTSPLCDDASRGRCSFWGSQTALAHTGLAIRPKH